MSVFPALLFCPGVMSSTANSTCMLVLSTVIMMLQRSATGHAPGHQAVSLSGTSHACQRTSQSPSNATRRLMSTPPGVSGDLHAQPRVEVLPSRT